MMSNVSEHFTMNSRNGVHLTMNSRNGADTLRDATVGNIQTQGLEQIGFVPWSRWAMTQRIRSKPLHLYRRI